MSFQNLKRDYILLSSLLLLAIITLVYPSLISHYSEFIDWKTIAILASLFLITTAMKDSGYLDYVAARVIKRIRGERNLAFALVILAFLLSMIVTNDVTLLVLVPFTLSLQKYLARDIKKIIIFETIGVNVGSALTPIGNPQNIYIWSLWKVSFFQFIFVLLPLVGILLLILLIFLYIIFPKRCLDKIDVKERVEKNTVMATISLIFLFLLIVVMHLDIFWYFLPVIFISYIIYGRKTYLHVDWALILIFILFFLDFNALGHIPSVENFLSSRDLSGLSAFTYGALFSQFMSNVPATILLSNFTTDFKALVYGVSVGGNGIIIASLANLIALRFVRDRKWIWEFHKYSIAYFLLSFGVVAILFLV